MPGFVAFRKAKRRSIERGSLEELIRLADQLEDGAHSATSTPAALTTSVIEAAENGAFRLLRLLSRNFGDAACRAKLASLPPDPALSRELLQWLLQLPRVAYPARLVDCVSALAAASARVAVQARGALATHATLSALRVVPVAAQSVQDIGRSALQALKADGPGSLQQRTKAVSDAVQNLTLWPADASATFRGELENAASNLARLAEDVADLRGAYEKAREVEVAAANLQALSTTLARAPAPVGTLPAQTRNGRVGPTLRACMIAAQEDAVLGRFAANVCKYALAVFDFLREKWGTALAAGAGLLIPAALLKQTLASLTTVDVSWASALLKLDPVDGFKLPLVGIVVGSCLGAVWLSFRMAQRKVLRVILDEGTEQYPARRSAGAFILRNTILAGAASVAAYSALALFIWSDAWNDLIPAAAAQETPSTTGSPPDVTRGALATGFRPVLTFGDVRVLRCVQAACMFGERTIPRGEPIAVRNEQTFADIATGARGRGATALIMKPTASESLMELRWPAQLPVLQHIVDVTGSVNLTGVASTDTAHVAVEIDDSSARAIGNALGVALMRIRNPPTTGQVTLKLPEGVERQLADLAAALKSEPAWLSALLATFDKNATATNVLADVAKRQEDCEETKLGRNLGERIHDGLHGYACQRRQGTGAEPAERTAAN